MGRSKKSQVQEHTQFDVLLNTKADSTRLMTLWYARKTFFTFLFSGFIGGAVTGHLRDIDIEWTNIDSVLGALASPIAGIILAIVTRWIVIALAMAAAYPVLQRRHKQLHLPYRTGIMQAFDHWFELRGLRELRWTRHVRERAMQQFETDFFRSGKPSAILVAINSILFGAFVIAALFFARSLT